MVAFRGHLLIFAGFSKAEGFSSCFLLRFDPTDERATIKDLGYFSLYTGCLIGIPIVVWYNPGSPFNNLLYTLNPKQLGAHFSIVKQRIELLTNHTPKTLDTKNGGPWQNVSKRLQVWLIICNVFFHRSMLNCDYCCSLVLQIPCKKVFRYPKPTPKPLAEGIGA